MRLSVSASVRYARAKRLSRSTAFSYWLSSERLAARSTYREAAFLGSSRCADPQCHDLLAGLPGVDYASQQVFCDHRERAHNACAARAQRHIWTWLSIRRRASARLGLEPGRSSHKPAPSVLLSGSSPATISTPEVLPAHRVRSGRSSHPACNANPHRGMVEPSPSGRVHTRPEQ